MKKFMYVQCGRKILNKQEDAWRRLRGMCWIKIADAVCFFADCAIMDIHGAIQPDLHVIRSYSQ